VQELLASAGSKRQNPWMQCMSQDTGRARIQGKSDSSIELFHACYRTRKDLN
jgi:hypothetical protein